jgi:hypothetical protein
MKKWNDLHPGIKVIVISIPFIIMLLYASYVHRNEPHWMEVRYVKIIK